MVEIWLWPQFTACRCGGIFLPKTLMNGKSYMVKLTIVDEISLQALDRCKENRKIPALLSHAVYDFVRTEEGKKILDRLAPRNSIEKKFY